MNAKLKLIGKMVIFLSPLGILVIVLNLCMPASTWVFRGWEALIKSNPYATVGWFYPNQKLTIRETGDLARNTPYSIYRKCYWQTDRLGYRNNYVPSSIDVLILGDSFTAGTGLTQKDTISSLLTTDKRTVYQVAPGNVNKLIVLLNTGIVSKPKTVVFSVAERDIPQIINIGQKHGKYPKVIPFKYEKWWIAFDRLKKNNALSFLRTMIKKQKTYGIQSEVDPRVFFLQGEQAQIASSERSLDRIVEVLQSYNNYFNNQGIAFMFLPIPNKESVYYDLVPLKEQPDFLYKLYADLRRNDIPTVNTLAMLTERRKERLYYFDDTHWNLTATRIIAERLNDYLSEVK